MCCLTNVGHQFVMLATTAKQHQKFGYIDTRGIGAVPQETAANEPHRGVGDGVQTQNKLNKHNLRSSFQMHT